MKRIVLLAFVAMLMGCAGAKIVTKEVPNSEPVATAEATPATPVATVAQIPLPTEPEKYKVKKGDCLWKIAGKVYNGDAFQWPALFKSNRDQIQDPDLIYPRQVFVVDRGQDKAKCKALALKTPKYHRHSHPRAKLPLDYF